MLRRRNRPGPGGVVPRPAPIAPALRLVVPGLYRHARNPIYLAMAPGGCRADGVGVRPAVWDH